MAAKYTPAEKAARTKQILDGAVAEAIKCGYQNITREAIARRIGVVPGTINIYYETMTQLKRDVMRYAVREGKLPIIAQGLAAGDPHAKKAPQELKERALASLVA